jgi:cytochrome b subunit of formate dehydrogenase
MKLKRVTFPQLGNVVYWICCVLAILMIVAGIIMALLPGTHNPWGALLFCWFIGGGAWLSGQYTRYISSKLGQS